MPPEEMKEVGRFAWSGSALVEPRVREEPWGVSVVELTERPGSCFSCLECAASCVLR